LKSKCIFLVGMLLFARPTRLLGFRLLGYERVKLGNPRLNALRVFGGHVPEDIGPGVQI
jgi:hypothetical protein